MVGLGARGWSYCRGTHLWQGLRLVERALADTGRVVLRYSGTEPVARIMVEGLDARAVRAHAERLARVVDGELGEG